MVRFFTVIFLFLAAISQSFAAPVGANNVNSIGGVETSSTLTIPESNPNGYFTVTGYFTGTSDTVSPFYKNGVLYQVTAGKTARVVKLCSWTNSTGTRIQLMSATATFATGATAISLTGPVWQCGANVNECMSAGTAAFVYACQSITYDFAATTWPGFQMATAAVGAAFAIVKEF